LRWWGAIINYTVFGEYFWTGKGFGINLADADGFQANEDRSLRAPHNSHMTALARMGVPGFLLWVLLQGAFGFGLLRSVLTNRRVGDANLAVVGAWILAYWVAMMVDTSFDPYLEGPQGGIWFWSLFGLGMVVIRLTSRRSEP
jgi:O-antigen ligase